ncbi:MAG TPA: hypothetical protein VJV75_01720 [Candidatus Polarisedimenticolia bacterium]|nr:hypothetical protein [Candidatus Polarisedimenticolia bacterium]
MILKTSRVSQWIRAGLFAAAGLGLASQADAATITLTANITPVSPASLMHWTADNEYVLGTVIYVESGVTLTIEPGTVVRGMPDASTPGVNDPGTLVITRGAKLFALGTRLKPIVFTNMDDDNIGSNPGSFPYDTGEDARGITGTWGGLILLGRTYVANNAVGAPNGAREVQIEGLVSPGGLGLYGNCAASALFPAGCDDDDSGTLEYVSIRYGGFNLSINNEINGLTLGGVGRETDIRNIEIFQGKDDAIEFFGGTVGVKNAVLFAPGDDGLDWDEGFRGKAQFVLLVQGRPGTDKSDKGGELDGGNVGDASLPRSIPTVYNTTFVGLGTGIGAGLDFTGRGENTALHFRDNSGGRWYNSAFLEFGGAEALIEGGTASSNSAGTSGERSGAAYVVNTGHCSVTATIVCTADAQCQPPATPGPEICVLDQRGPASTFELELEDDTFYCIRRQEDLRTGTFPVGGPRPANVLVTRGVCSTDGSLCLTSATCPAAGSCDDAPEDYGIALPGDANRFHHDNGMLTNAALDNQYVACGTLPIRNLVRDVVTGDSLPDPVLTIDPRPATGSPLLTTNRTPPADGFFEPAPYRGAFLNDNWAAGWTNMARLGYFPPKPQVTLTANITPASPASLMHWTADNEYVLGTVIYVEPGVTLIIDPGTVVRGMPDASTPGVNDPGTLVIGRGSKLIAQGTVDKPIVFTNMDDSNVDGHPGIFPYDIGEDARGITGTWGGLILLGRTFVANNTAGGPNASREVQIEGLISPAGFGMYGNCAASALFPAGCDDDDSGTLEYLSIRYGGFNLAPNNEINSLTLGGVGRETDIRNIETFQGKDDAIEFFGGTVGVKNAVLFAPGDDGLDWDEGYRGKIQFVLLVQGRPGTDKSDKGGELDGGNVADTSLPRSIPTVYNTTFVGLGSGIGAGLDWSGRGENTALHFRDNSGGRWYNSAFLEFGGAEGLIEGGVASGNSAGTSGERAGATYTPNSGHCSITTSIVCTADTQCQPPATPGPEVCVIDYRGPASTFELEVEDNTFYCIRRQEDLRTGTFPVGAPRLPNVMVTQGVCSNNGAACLTSASCGGGSCDDAPEDYGIALPGDANRIHFDNGMLTNAARDNQYVACGSLPVRNLVRDVVTGDALPDPVLTLDPRPAAGSPLLVTNRTPPNDGFFTPAPYRGAFGTVNWSTNWTNFGTLGYAPSCSGGNGVVPDEVTGLLSSGGTTNYAWDKVGLPGGSGIVQYDVLRTTDRTTFAAATCVKSNAFDAILNDPAVPPLGQFFYYQIRAENACGMGTMGYSSTGVERTGPACN